MDYKYNFSFATEQDIPRLVNIVKKCFPKAPEWNSPKFIIARWWKLIIQSDDSKVIVLRESGQVQSFIIYVTSESVWDKLERTGPNSIAAKTVAMLTKPKVLRSRLKKLLKLREKRQVESPRAPLFVSKVEQESARLQPEFFAALMGVDPQFRKKGIGRSMLKECEKIAFERGTVFVKIYVDPRNIKAQEIYLSMGYAHAGRSKNSLMMTKMLP